MNELNYLSQANRKINIISDLHIKSPTDPSYHLLLKFLTHPSTLECNAVILLGDIFDLMIGNHDEYIQLYHHYFNELKKLLGLNIHIIYIQGNHDFHMEKMYKKFIDLNNIHPHLFTITDTPITNVINNKLTYIGHGDELEISNISYQKYKKIIRSHAAKLAATSFVSFNTLCKIGAFLAVKSKHAQKNFNFQLRIELYRSLAKNLWDQGYNRVILGHNHYTDAIRLDTHQTFEYYNIGYPPTDRHFLSLNANDLYFVPLDNE
jgi:UDP-2,3-diacylglucosamine hydrolase